MKIFFNEGIHFDTERFIWVKVDEYDDGWEEEEWNGKTISRYYGALIDGRYRGNIVMQDEPRECTEFPWDIKLNEL